MCCADLKNIDELPGYIGLCAVLGSLLSKTDMHSVRLLTGMLLSYHKA